MSATPAGPQLLSYNQQAQLHIATYARLISFPYRPLSIAEALTLNGPIDIQALESALNTIIKRHESLRSSFSLVSEQRRGSELLPDVARLSPFGRSLFVSEIHPYSRVALRMIDLCVPRANHEEEIHRRAVEVIEEPFDYGAPPLIRTVLLRTSPTSHLFVNVMSHLISDGWSARLFRRDIGKIYGELLSGSATVSPSRITTQYVDFVKWQWQQCVNGEVHARNRSYWLQQCREFIPMTVHDLPFAGKRGEVLTGSSVEVITLPQEVVEAAKACAVAHKVTLYVLLLASFKVLLHLYTAKSRIAIWALFANRPYPQWANSIGWFAHPLFVGSRITPDLSFIEVLRLVRGSVLGAMSHQEFPLPLLLPRTANAGSRRAREYGDETPVVAARNIDFDFVPRLQGDFLVNVSAEIVPLPSHTYAGLTILIIDGDEVFIKAQYQRSVLNARSVRKMLCDYQEILGHIASNPSLSLRSLPIKL